MLSATEVSNNGNFIEVAVGQECRWKLAYIENCLGGGFQREADRQAVASLSESRKQGKEKQAMAGRESWSGTA